MKKKSQFQMLKELELSENDFKTLADYCLRRKIIFLSTPFSEKSANFLRTIEMSAYKIGSGEITNWPFLRHIAGFGKPIILSTGMSTMTEVKEAVELINSAGNSQLVLLHCTSTYPAALPDVNLRAITSLAADFDCLVGFSDHTEDIHIAPAAVALGARVIEKHITLDRSLPGPDHKASIEPLSFARMVTLIRNLELALGSGVKRPASREKEIKMVSRKSLVAARDIASQSIISSDMLLIRRPGTGIEPKYFDLMVGKKTRRPIKAGTLLAWDMFR